MISRPRSAPRVLAACALVLAGACGTADAEPARTRYVYTVEGFDQPESVQYDPRQDLFFVSAMAGYGSVKDSVGYIARFRADAPERWEIFVRSGRDGVMLHSPKGMALQGDTLWVADIDVLRGFHRRTGAPVAEIDLKPYGATLLNAVAVAPDGTVYITDSAIVMSNVGVMYTPGDRIYAIAPGGAVGVAAEGEELHHPNGIDWDHDDDRLIVASFHPFVSEVYTVRPGEGRKEALATGTGRFDGLQRLPDGRILVTSWSDSSLYLVHGGRKRRIATRLWQPADIGVDTRRQRVAIPQVIQGKVEVWEIPPR